MTNTADVAQICKALAKKHVLTLYKNFSHLDLSLGYIDIIHQQLVATRQIQLRSRIEISLSMFMHMLLHQRLDVTTWGKYCAIYGSF